MVVSASFLPSAAFRSVPARSASARRARRLLPPAADRGRRRRFSGRSSPLGSPRLVPGSALRGLRSPPGSAGGAGAGAVAAPGLAARLLPRSLAGRTGPGVPRSQPASRGRAGWAHAGLFSAFRSAVPASSLFTSPAAPGAPPSPPSPEPRVPRALGVSPAGSARCGAAVGAGAGGGRGVARGEGNIRRAGWGGGWSAASCGAARGPEEEAAAPPAPRLAKLRTSRALPARPIQGRGRAQELSPRRARPSAPRRRLRRHRRARRGSARSASPGEGGPRSRGAQLPP